MTLRAKQPAFARPGYSPRMAHSQQHQHVNRVPAKGEVIASLVKLTREGTVQWRRVALGAYRAEHAGMSFKFEGFVGSRWLTAWDKDNVKVNSLTTCVGVRGLYRAVRRQVKDFGAIHAGHDVLLNSVVTQARQIEAPQG